MSLFKPYNYKDKPDIPKDAPAKHPLIVFFEILGRKLWRFTCINFIYFVVTLPLLLCFYFAMSGFLADAATGELVDLMPGVGALAAGVAYLPESLFYALLAVSIVLYGPLKMGATYIYRNFARQEHAWFSDLFARAWANRKQGLFFGILDVAVVSLLVFNMLGLFVSDDAAVQLILTAIGYLSALFLVFYLIMRHYFYILAVTMELSVFAIIKNSFLFAIMGLGRNILVSLACLAVWVLSLLFNPALSLIALPLFSFALCGFITVYFSYPLVHRHIVRPALERDGQADK